MTLLGFDGWFHLLQQSLSASCRPSPLLTVTWWLIIFFTSLHYEHSLPALKSPHSPSINVMLLRCQRGPLPIRFLVMLTEQTSLHSKGVEHSSYGPLWLSELHISHCPHTVACFALCSIDSFLISENLQVQLFVFRFVFFCSVTIYHAI